MISIYSNPTGFTDFVHLGQCVEVSCSWIEQTVPRLTSARVNRTYELGASVSVLALTEGRQDCAGLHSAQCASLIDALLSAPYELPERELTRRKQKQENPCLPGGFLEGEYAVRQQALLYILA